jgi:hypothetical protein
MFRFSFTFFHVKMAGKICKSPFGHPVWDDLGVEPPGAIHIGQMLLKHAVLQHVLGHCLVPVNQPSKSTCEMIEKNVYRIEEFFKY